MAAAARRAGFVYRRPVPLKEDDDDAEVANKQRESALLELEMGLAAAAHGPPHQGGAPGEDGEDDRGVLRRFPSLDTAEAAAFPMEWDGEAFHDGKDDKTDDKRSPSSDPASFQDAREASRSLLTTAAFFATMGKNMMAEHKRARNEADLYMGEVIRATNKLPNSSSAVLLNNSSCPGSRVARPGSRIDTRLKYIEDGVRILAKADNAVKRRNQLQKDLHVPFNNETDAYNAVACSESQELLAEWIGLLPVRASHSQWVDKVLQKLFHQDAWFRVTYHNEDKTYELGKNHEVWEFGILLLRVPPGILDVLGTMIKSERDEATADKLLLQMRNWIRNREAGRREHMRRELQLRQV